MVRSSFINDCKQVFHANKVSIILMGLNYLSMRFIELIFESTCFSFLREGWLILSEKQVFLNSKVG